MGYYLFPITERKLESNEFPHSVYIRTYSALSTTSLALRKWIFTLARVCTWCCFSVDVFLFYLIPGPSKCVTWPFEHVGARLVRVLDLKPRWWSLVEIIHPVTSWIYCNSALPWMCFVGNQLVSLLTAGHVYACLRIIVFLQCVQQAHQCFFQKAFQTLYQNNKLLRF